MKVLLILTHIDEKNNFCNGRFFFKILENI